MVYSLYPLRALRYHTKENEPMQNLSRLSLGKYLVTIDPQAQQVTISGTLDPLVLSFPDASLLLDLLSCHRELFSQALYAHLAPLPDWAQEEIPNELMQQLQAAEDAREPPHPRTWSLDLPHGHPRGISR
jgi:hypothetical protein